MIRNWKRLLAWYRKLYFCVGKLLVGSGIFRRYITDSDQPVHLPNQDLCSLCYILQYPDGQWRMPWSDCLNEQAILSTCCPHTLTDTFLLGTYMKLMLCWKKMFLILIIIIIIIIRFFINVQVQGQHQHQWAPFQVAGLLHIWHTRSPGMSIMRVDSRELPLSAIPLCQPCHLGPLRPTLSINL